MKKITIGLIGLSLLAALAGCSSTADENLKTENLSEEESQEADAELVDGTYDGYDPQPTYLARGLVTIQDGKAVSIEFEECHLPSYWATYTEEEAAAAGEAEVLAIEGTKGTTYYARHVVVGTGEEAIHLIAQDEVKEAANGSSYVVYGNEEIDDFSTYMEEDSHAAWYYEQILTGNYWIEDADGNLKEELAVYTTTRSDGVVLDKVDSRLKTKIMHWTAVGTGVGTEMGENGWTGNLQIIADTLLENQFPEGEVTKNDENQVIIADIITSATIEEYQGYVQMFYDAYNKAKA